MLFCIQVPYIVECIYEIISDSGDLKPNSITLSWSQTGPKLVADRFAAGLIKPNSITLPWSQTGPKLAADLSQARASELDDRPSSSSLQACDQPQTCLRPASVLSATRITQWILAFGLPVPVPGSRH